MKGTVLAYSVQEGTGTISGQDGKHYEFSHTSWQDSAGPSKGQTVDFDVNDGTVGKVFLVNDAPVAAGGISNERLVAALLAFFLGAFGAHKFYLGKTTAGIIMLVVFLFGFILLGIPSFIIGVIAFVEFIIYLIKPNEDFHREYVEGDKAWF
ncbi:TM2 domain-containing protein [Gallaecimonas kandeliae]|uniref:TM2 domain-containing protein n=1 Tax=Gallaecimonas kandeliae TaxID=3029055 RepID=UPI0026473401|nr:TM2 domain-containing protein [Gallaecimonas kandeliae]WKE65624.1 TM2 domain-containing protein [Gallaecimonas kandeliae]